MQRGIKGHVIVYPQKPEKVAAVLPPAISDIMNPICVIFVGSRPPTRKWLEDKAKPLVVRQQKIMDALQWLKVNNPLYADLVIDMQRIKDLPANGILPHDIQHLSQDESSSAVTARYDEGEPEFVEGASTRDIKRDRVEFHKVVITDVEGRAPANELRAAAIRHFKHKGGGYVEIPHQPKPVNEFYNPALFPMTYPTLFPYGVGGCEDKIRKRAISLKRHVRHL
ncbi:uncharacterized protein TRAVEDRAFT_113908, partial [Trametes versicolor FP-101664 SS1]|uniref:uncharacterized protein n=1 Tax=Trametes versicolor (strain FP-101664) TaxID=717944 RepID=UPI0004622838